MESWSKQPNRHGHFTAIPFVLVGTVHVVNTLLSIDLSWSNGCHFKALAKYYKNTTLVSTDFQNSLMWLTGVKKLFF